MTETFVETYLRNNKDGGPAHQAQWGRGLTENHEIHEVNAFAHALSTATIAYNYNDGEFARNLGIVNELGQLARHTLDPFEPPFDFDDSAQDLFNNDVGILVAQHALDNYLPVEALFELILDVTKRGL